MNDVVQVEEVLRRDVLVGGLDGACDRSAGVRKLPSPTVVPPRIGRVVGVGVEIGVHVVAGDVDGSSACRRTASRRGDSVPPAAGPATTSCGLTAGLTLNTL